MTVISVGGNALGQVKRRDMRAWDEERSALLGKTHSRIPADDSRLFAQSDGDGFRSPLPERSSQSFPIEIRAAA
jgi:hypothetical protein